VLDEIGQTVDDSGDENLIVLQRGFGEAAKLVGVARISERQHEAADLRFEQGRKNVRERNVAVVRRFRVSPAHV
jgi:hypothetical protein